MSKKLIDVTDKVEYQLPDGSMMPISKCVCGTEFQYIGFPILDSEKHPEKCPNCGALLFFEQKITVYQVQELDE